MTNKDFDFIAKKIKLSRETTVKLCEEPRDLDLVLDQIVKKRLTKKDFQGISFGLYAKLVIFSKTIESGFDLSEKSVVATLISELFPRLNNRTNFAPFIRKITPTPNESGAKYYLLLSSLFADKVNCKDALDIRIKYIASGLSCLHPSLSTHIAEWIEILKKLKSDGYFSVTIAEEKVPELESCPRFVRDLTKK